MKARVKATGNIIEVERIGIASDIWALQSDSTVVFDDEELDINIEPDYWKKLKHQYAGMAMQGILSSDKMLGILGMQKGKELDDMIGNMSVKIATALVNRLKEDSQCEK